MIHLNNLLPEDAALPERLAEELIRGAEAVLGHHGLDYGEVGITLTGNSYLQQLNREYRGLDEPTDVLSFPMMEKQELQNLGAEGPEEVLLGDVFISLEKAATQAQDAGHSLREETLLLAIHGTLHLLGYDHAEEEETKLMKEQEELFLKMLMG